MEGIFDPETEPDPTVHKDGQIPTHLVLEDYGGSGLEEVEPVPRGWFYDRTLNRGGENWEHVRNDRYDRWVYRRM